MTTTLPAALKRLYSHSALDRWISIPNKHIVLRDSLSAEHLSDLFISLPTRDGSSTSHPYIPPDNGDPLPYGHHLAFFHPRHPEHLLRNDGTDADFCPPEPFTRRMWASGSMTWNHQCPLLVGTNANAVSVVSQVTKKNFDGPSPLVFVKQGIDYSSEDGSDVAIREERSHVYLLQTGSSRYRRVVKEVNDLPKSQFSFTHTPTLTTLFRFSALTFNGHYIHLDKDYAQRVEGYPERLVHGPLSALMLLENFVYHHPDAKLSSFDYRAVNPLTVNNTVTINGAWVNDKTIKVWVVKDLDGVVCMTGNIGVL